MNIETFLKIQSEYNRLDALKNTYHSMGSKTSIEFLASFKKARAEYDVALDDMQTGDEIFKLVARYIDSTRT